MPRAIVREDCFHRVPKEDGEGLGELVGPGTIVTVTMDELVAFADKLEPLGDDVPSMEEPWVKFDQGIPVGSVLEKPMDDFDLFDFDDEEEDDEFEEVEFTDAALSLAEEYDIELADVPGTGVDGRILKKDVEAYIDSFGLDD